MNVNARTAVKHLFIKQVMKKVELKFLAINAGFTILIGLFIFGLILEAKIYFNSKAKGIFKNLNSDLSTYKVKYVQEEKAVLPEYAISSSTNAQFQKPAILSTRKLVNIYEEEGRLEEENIIASFFQQNIEEDPLFKGYYIQLGIFASKDVAQMSIQNLISKSLIEENLTTYIETKAMEDRTFYLAQIGVFSDKNEAIKFCDKLQKMQIGCVVID